MKNSQIKLLLAILWLLCYLPFKSSYVASEQPTAVLHLGELQPFDDGDVDDRWHACLAYLDDHNIHSSIRVRCNSHAFDVKFHTWLSRLELDGHQIVHDENCTCDASSRSSLNDIGYQSAHRAEFISKEANLLLSLPVDFFKDQFLHLSKKANYFIIEGDPTEWTEKHFSNFQKNIQYLILEGIKFDISEADSI